MTSDHVKINIRTNALLIELLELYLPKFGGLGWLGLSYDWTGVGEAILRGQGRKRSLPSHVLLLGFTTK